MPFPKGQSPNPGGRPRLARAVLVLARVDSEEAYGVAREIMRDPDHKQQLAAAVTILRLSGAFRSADLAAEQEDATPGQTLQPAQTYSLASLKSAAKGDA